MKCHIGAFRTPVLWRTPRPRMVWTSTKNPGTPAIAVERGRGGETSNCREWLGRSGGAMEDGAPVAAEGAGWSLGESAAISSYRCWRCHGRMVRCPEKVSSSAM